MRSNGHDNVSLRGTALALCALALAGNLPGCMGTSGASGLSAQTYGGSSTFALVNDLGRRVCYVHLVPAGLESWGDDWLGSTEVIEPGASRSFSIAPLASWDVRLLNCNREVLLERRGVVLHAGATASAASLGGFAQSATGGPPPPGGRGSAQSYEVSAVGTSGVAVTSPRGGDPSQTTGMASGSLLSPPYFGRIFIGRVPFQSNDLVYSFYNGTGNLIEVWMDGSELIVALNSQRSMRPVVRGDHAGRTVSLYPASNWDNAQMMVDSPGAHGFELWCYTDLPGLGLVQVGHRTLSSTTAWPVALGCR